MGTFQSMLKMGIKKRSLLNQQSEKEAFLLMSWSKMRVCGNINIKCHQIRSQIRTQSTCSVINLYFMHAYPIRNFGQMDTDIYKDITFSPGRHSQQRESWKHIKYNGMSKCHDKVYTGDLEAIKLPGGRKAELGNQVRGFLQEIIL